MDAKKFKSNAQVRINRSSPEVSKSRRQPTVQNYLQLPLAFEANQGQTDAQVKFMSRGSGYNLYLTPTEAVLTLRKALENLSAKRGLADSHDPRGRRERGPTSSEITTLRMQLVGANAKTEVAGVEQQSTRVNYFLGNDPTKWQTDVRTYARVQYKDVYRGVDLAYYGQQRQLEYDFVVKPGADPNQIRLRFDGAKKMRIDESGDLILTTKGGEVRQRRPLVYQEVASGRNEIAGTYTVKANREVGFEIGSYDLGLPLVIDPVLVYSTYLGGSGDEIGYGIAVDPAGNAYVTGYTRSANFPTLNPYQSGNAGGNYDAFVTKLTASGGLSYSTYLGGNNIDVGLGIAVDTDSNAYVTGYTSSTNFPTLNAYQASNGGPEDAFVTKLTASGGLSYSTYLGGIYADTGEGIAVDSTGNAYLTGHTESPNFPTLNAPFGSHAGGPHDAFVTKLTATGGLSYSTYLGGIGDDRGFSIAVDSSGNAYVAGETPSTNFPTLNAFQASPNGLLEAFVTKLTASGGLSYSTYLGGSDEDRGRGIAVDSLGSAYLTGYTYSTNFPTLNASQASLSGVLNAFVTKLTASGGLNYSTYLGSDFGTTGLAIAADSVGNAYVTGGTASNFPTLDAFQPGYGGGSFDAFVTKLTASGGLSYSTYLGGNGHDHGRGIGVDSAGNAYVTGQSYSTNFPTLGASQASNGGGSDAFVTKIDDTATPTPTPTPTPSLGNYADTTVGLSSNAAISPSATPTDTTSIDVSTSTNFQGTFAADPVTGVVSVTDAHPAGIYTVTVMAFGSGGTVATTFQLTVTTGTACIGTPGFTNGPNVSVGNLPLSIAIGDFNNDGNQDFAVANINSNNVSIRLGDGSGVFGGGPNVAVGNSPRAVAIGDFNGDGMQDFAVPASAANAVSIRLGDGAGGFTGTTEVGVGDDPWSVAIGDLNNDGKQDIAAAASDAGTVSIRLGNGSGGFTGSTEVTVGSLPRSVVIGDFNNDGKQDFAAANNGSNDVSIRLGNGAGGFTSAADVSVGSNPFSVAIGDFNNDGFQDLAVANFSFGSSTVSIRIGDGTGLFTNANDVTAGTTGFFPASVATADFNNDGKQDLAVANFGLDTVLIRLGDGAGGFTGSSDIGVSVGVEPWSVAIGDFNNDGKQDFATANSLAAEVSVRLGTCEPPTPTTLILSSSKDSFLRSGSDDTNEGANERLRIQSSGNNRAVVAFDLTGVSIVGLQSATLVLTIAENSNNWGTSGRVVDTNRLLVNWTEGNGRNDVMVGGGPGFRGTGAGVTWHCGTDTNIFNQVANCSPLWNGGSYAGATAAGALHTNGLLGQVSWDVTADVLAGANFGWVIRKQNEGQNGQVRYYSREGAALSGNASLAPRLILVYSQ